MNIKLRIKVNRIKDKILEILRKVLTPLATFEDKKSNERYRKIKEYNKNMSDEELMSRYAKHMVKRMIKYKKEKVCFYICNKRYQYDDLDYGFIVYELRNLSSCKDKYLKSWYYTANKYSLWDGNIMEVENRLNKLLSVEVEKLGCRVEYIDESEKMSEYWVRGSDYQKTMVIYLPE